MSTPTTDTAIAHDLGRLQGEMTAVKDSIDRLGKTMSDGFDKIDQRMRELEAKENQRKGALATLMVLAGGIGAIAGMVGAVVGKLMSVFTGGH